MDSVPSLLHFKQQLQQQQMTQRKVSMVKEVNISAPRLVCEPQEFAASSELLPTSSLTSGSRPIPHDKMEESGTSITHIMEESGTTHMRLYRNALVDNRRGDLILSETGIVFAPENSLGIEEIWQWDLIRTYLLSLDKRMLMIFLSGDKKPLKIKPAEHYQAQLLSDEIRICREEANSKLDTNQDQPISPGKAEQRPSRIYTDSGPDAVSVLSDEAGKLSCTFALLPGLHYPRQSISL